MRLQNWLISLLVTSALFVTGCSRNTTAPLSSRSLGSGAGAGTSGPTATAIVVSGAVTAIAADQSSLTVGATLVAVGAHTLYGGLGSPASLADFHVGDLVRVLAARRPDGSLLALSVIRVPPPSTGVKFSGRIASITAPDLVVAGRTVVTDANTAFFIGLLPATFADLKVGELVIVRGTLQADGTVLAAEVRVFTPEVAPGHTLTGMIRRIGTDGIDVGGELFAVDASTVVVIGDHPATLADLKVGMIVEVTFVTPAAGLPPLAIRIAAREGVDE